MGLLKCVVVMELPLLLLWFSFPLYWLRLYYWTFGAPLHPLPLLSLHSFIGAIASWHRQLSNRWNKNILMIFEYIFKIYSKTLRTERQTRGGQVKINVSRVYYTTYCLYINKYWKCILLTWHTHQYPIQLCNQHQRSATNTANISRIGNRKKNSTNFEKCQCLSFLAESIGWRYYGNNTSVCYRICRNRIKCKPIERMKWSTYYINIRVQRLFLFFLLLAFF